MLEGEYLYRIAGNEITETLSAMCYVLIQGARAVDWLRNGNTIEYLGI